MTPWQFCTKDLFALFAVVWSLLLLGACESAQDNFQNQVTQRLMIGRDSAGAIVELEEQNEEVIRARVSDKILGTGETADVSVGNGFIEFTIDFPAGAIIVYHGQVAAGDELYGVFVSGTWYQYPNGVFASDFGTWEASSSIASTQ